MGKKKSIEQDDFPFPKVIHQTYKSMNSLSKEWRGGMEDWKRLHPNWEYRFYDDNQLRNTVKKFAPECLSTYDGYRDFIQKVDMGRVVMLRYGGGVWSDSDQAPLCNIEPIFKDTKAEAYFASTSFALVTNSFMAGRAGAPIWTEILNEMIRVRALGTYSGYIRHFRIMLETGPWLVSRVIQKYQGGSLCILPSSFNPHEYDESQQSLHDQSIVDVNGLNVSKTTANNSNKIWMRKLKGSGSWHSADSKLMESIVIYKTFFITTSIIGIIMFWILALVFVLYVLYGGMRLLIRSTTTLDNTDFVKSATACRGNAVSINCRSTASNSSYHQSTISPLFSPSLSKSVLVK